MPKSWPQGLSLIWQNLCTMTRPALWSPFWQEITFADYFTRYKNTLCCVVTRWRKSLWSAWVAIPSFRWLRYFMQILQPQWQLTTSYLPQSPSQEGPIMAVRSVLFYFLFLSNLSVRVWGNIPSLNPSLFCNMHHSLSLFADDILLYINNAPSSLPHILDVFAQFSSLSGYKINWSKSQLMPLKPSLHPYTLPLHIPVVRSFKYLGVDIHPSLQSISMKNFQNILRWVEEDLDRWTKLPNSLSARISIIKMDTLPRINIFSSMIPLPPPIGYWDKLNKVISKFDWGGKWPRIKFSTLQRSKSDGGLAVPNSKLYFWSYVQCVLCQHGLTPLLGSHGDQ